MLSRSRLIFFLNQQLIPGLINGLINSAIAWAMYRNTLELGLWDRGAYAIDLLATGFLLPAISWLIVQHLLQRQASAGKAPSLTDLSRPWLLRWMRSTRWEGAARVGLMGMLLVGGCVVGALVLAGSPHLKGTDYAVFKGLFGALLSLVLQPAMVFSALQGGQPQALFKA